MGKVAYYTQRYADMMDRRMKLINDMLSGIRVVKAYAWEGAFTDAIGKVRDREIGVIRRHGYWTLVGLSTIFMQIPHLMQMATILAYVYGGGEISPSRIFVMIQLFQLLQQPLQGIPSALNALANLEVAQRRLGAFFKLAEIEQAVGDTLRGKPEPGLPAIELNEASYAWAPLNVEAWQVELPKSRVELAEEAKIAAAAAERAAAAEGEEKLARSGAGQGQGNGNGNGNGASAAAPEDVELDAVDGKAEAAAAGEVPAGQEKEETKFQLEGLNLSIPAGSLVGVVGTVGSGKSSLLGALLNEMHKLDGTLTVRGEVSYAAQQAWIQNNTLRGNVLFDKEYDPVWYDRVVEASELRADFKAMEDGDMTEIGERGINLSGGQKARVGLARALYSKADIALLDDPLAAVDTHVADHIFNEAICGLLKEQGTTTILVTNQLHRLPMCDIVIWMDQGKVKETGSFSELEAAGLDFAALMDRQGVQSEEAVEPEVPSAEEEELGKAEAGSEPGTPSGRGRLDSTPKGQGKSLHDDEERESGTVEWEIYRWYANHVGWKVCVLMGIFTSCQVYFPVFAQWSLAEWTDEAVSNPGFNDHDPYIQRYCILLCCGMMANAIWAAASAEGRATASASIHTELTASICRVPVAFFDVTPLGRVLNRFSKDVQSIDMLLMVMVSWMLVTFSAVFGSAVGIMLATKGFMAVVIIPVLYIYLQIANFVRCSSVDLQRLQSVSRSPLYSSFSEMLTGLATVRAFRMEPAFVSAHRRMLNSHLSSHFFSISAMPAWLTLRLNLMGATLMGSVAAFSKAWPEMSSAGGAGLGITYSMNISFMMMIAIFVGTVVETQMNSVERLKHYIHAVKHEAEPVIHETAPHTEWPSQGTIEIQDLVMGYRDGPDVLHSVTATITPGEKIGVVGRTGSGKSTLLLAMFRLLEARHGCIRIDGVDISTIGLHQLRSRLGIIPQDPVLFVGTLRYNLDPFQQHGDAALWAVLESVQLKPLVEGFEAKLEEAVEENGSNFSVGQRQLVCIARALLLNPQILMLDEATASIDSETDALLQKMIRQEFQTKTVLSIAHRLDTIIDYDRVMVLDQGNLVEFDSPERLLAKPGGVFAAMVASREGSTGHLTEMAREAAAARDTDVAKP